MKHAQRRDVTSKQPPDYYAQAHLSAFSVAGSFHRMRVKELLKHVPRGSDVLDVGCGSGVLMRELKDKKACRVVGIELDSETAKFAARFAGAGVHAGDLRKAHLRKKFQTVVCSDVIEHFDERELGGVLRSLVNFVAQGGILILMFPTRAYLLGVEPLWKQVRGTLNPRVRFDDETHYAVEKRFVEVRVNEMGMRTLYGKKCCFGMETVLVFKK